MFNLVQIKVSVEMCYEYTYVEDLKALNKD